MENTANHITLTGTLASLPEYSHQNHERRFGKDEECDSKETHEIKENSNF